MLSRLKAETKEIPCIDEVDETTGKFKWTQKAKDEMKKLNTDCNLTAGLEAVLQIAVGARVMLRRNIDTRSGLVNGAIGTMVSIKTHHITVQFDGIQAPCDIERVKSKFMERYVHRKQFPLILAFAVTVHKCQGQSLDCAMMDLSNKVFCAGVAYVALSRVEKLENLHLIAFTEQAIKVSSKCLHEINRLRQTYRPDLPQYTIPRETQPQKGKRKQSGTVLLSPKRQKVDGKRKTDKPVAPLPPAKKKCPPRKVVSKPSPQPNNEKSGGKEVLIHSDLILLSPDVLLYPKRQKVDGKRRTDKPVTPLPPEKKKCPPRIVVSKHSTQPRKEKSGYKEVVIDSDLILLLPEEPVVPEWYQRGIFNPLGEETQRRLCRQLGLRFIKSNGCTGGGTDVPLRAPRSIKEMATACSVHFPMKSLGVNGSICFSIIHYMTTTDECMRLLAGHIVDDVTLDNYIQHTRIDEEGTWGSQTEMYVLAHMTFNTRARMYEYLLPGCIDQERYPDDLTRPAIYPVHWKPLQFSLVAHCYTLHYYSKRVQSVSRPVHCVWLYSTVEVKRAEEEQTQCTILCTNAVRVGQQLLIGKVCKGLSPIPPSRFSCSAACEGEGVLVCVWLGSCADTDSLVQTQNQNGVECAVCLTR